MRNIHGIPDSASLAPEQGQGGQNLLLSRDDARQKGVVVLEGNVKRVFHGIQIANGDQQGSFLVFSIMSTFT